tara:strand:+ start:1891 stop:2259 length:369 start_codon:yes stop_codon:yes gene_type:complete
MALLDVSEVLSDPDLIEPTGLVRIRRVQTVSAQGLASNTETPLAFSGVVTAGKGDSLRRTADGNNAQGNMTVTTTTDLRPEMPGQDADIVVWQGRRYIVESIAEYRNFGYVQAYCDLLPLAG